MSIKHTSTTIGTKPLAAIVAEFAATITYRVERKPDGPGWIEGSELAKALKMNRWAFGDAMRAGVAAGKYERASGSKMRANGQATGTMYYRIKPHPAQIAPKETKRAKGGV